MSQFVPISAINDLDDLHFTLTINGEVRQQGDTSLMLNKIIPLIAHMSTIFTLDAGDVVLTGTPKGVGPLLPGDNVSISLQDHFTLDTKVIGQ